MKTLSGNKLYKCALCGHESNNYNVFRTIYLNYQKELQNSDYKFKYTYATIDRASENGHVNVLEWFKNSEFDFKL